MNIDQEQIRLVHVRGARPIPIDDVIAEAVTAVTTWFLPQRMSSGTQSPPLEATDSHVPMGVSSIDGTCSKPTKDIHQRAGKSKNCHI